MTDASWKPFELYATKFWDCASKIRDFKQAINLSYEYPAKVPEAIHTKHMAEIADFWDTNQEILVELLTRAVPVKKQYLLNGYIDYLTKNLPELKTKSQSIPENGGSLSLLLRDSQKALLRIAAKLDERGRWYRVQNTKNEDTEEDI